MIEISTDIQVLLFLLAVFLILAVLLYKNFISKHKNTGGGGFITMGSTYDIQTKDKRAAIQEIVEIKAQKKMEEQESSDTNPKWIIKDE